MMLVERNIGINMRNKVCPICNERLSLLDYKKLKKNIPFTTDCCGVYFN